MRVHVQRPRLSRTPPIARQRPRVTIGPRKLVRADRALVRRPLSAPDPTARDSIGLQPDPYVDYGRFLTPEGGILLIYKDLDTRLRHTLWRFFAWSAATGGEGWYLFHAPPVQNVWVNLACLLAIGLLNWFIVKKPVEVYRRMEFRPDCLILEGTEVFWLRLMEAGWPGFKPDEDGNQILGSIYGTRFVEYATIRRFDELDRMPEVVAAHVQDAMAQLWGRAQEYT